MGVVIFSEKFGYLTRTNFANTITSGVLEFESVTTAKEFARERGFGYSILDKYKYDLHFLLFDGNDCYELYSIDYLPKPI